MRASIYPCFGNEVLNLNYVITFAARFYNFKKCAFHVLNQVYSTPYFDWVKTRVGKPIYFMYYRTPFCIETLCTHLNLPVKMADCSGVTYVMMSHENYYRLCHFNVSFMKVNTVIKLTTDIGFCLFTCLLLNLWTLTKL